MDSIRVNSAGFWQTPANWSLTPARTRAWPDLDLWFLVGGRGEVVCAEGTFRLAPGACLVMRGGMDYTFKPAPGKPFRHYWAHFDLLDDTGQAIPPASAPAPAFYRMLEEPRLLELVFDRLVRAVNETPSRDTVAHEAGIWMAAALAEIETADRRSALQHANPPRDIDVWVDELCQTVRAHPEKDWTVLRMAKELGMCRSYFYKVFLRRTGRSPQRFVMEERMRIARVYLRESTNPIGWIAEQLGYRDVYFFSRQFKQLHGCSPRAYRGK